ncbi:MAG TPA: helix-turn-helix domain-containing protein [Candidatus Acidoferrum sp.]
MSARQTQRDRLLALLHSRENEWVPLPEILALGIAQFGARILELRRAGFDIANKIERDESSVVHSWYRLLASPKNPEAPKPETAMPFGAVPSDGDWYEREHGPRSVQ